MKIPKRNRWFQIALIGLSVVLFLICVSMVFISTLTLDIYLDGNDPLVLDYGTTYSEPGAHAVLSSNLIAGFRIEIPVTQSLMPEDAATGDTKLYYSASFLWLKAQASRTVTLVDTIAPVISLVENQDSFTLPGHAYEEEGFTAIDNCDGDITHLVQRTVTETEVIYTVADSSGNTTEVRRSIRYHDPDAPVLTLTGDANMTLIAGTQFKEPGYTATDNCDGDLTAKVTVEGKVDIYTPGTYTLTYQVSDTYGNTTTVTRTVLVKIITQSDVVDPGDKIIYLTFDDGPCSYTAGLLDVLAKYNVKATFFVTNQSASYLSVMKRIVNEGHSIGVHTATHEYSDIYSSKENFFADFNKMRQLIYDYTGVWTNLSRFPGGSANSTSMNYCPGIMTELAKDLTDMGYVYFDWNVSSNDTGSNKTADAVFEAVIAGIQKRNVSCVLQHDIKPQSVQAVERIIQWGLANGYTFLALDSTSPTFHHTIRN